MLAPDARPRLLPQTLDAAAATYALKSMNRELHYLAMAARLAQRGHGGAEPNPMVGAVIVNESSSEGARTHQIVGRGYHRQCGGPHAEIMALKQAGDRARGATLYCTLEPCNHTGRTPPCTQAIIDAGIRRVVIARRDPNPVATGGMKRLQQAGISVEINDRCRAAIMVSDPFVHRVQTGLPWVVAKWAQTIDGKIATRPPHNDSQWISNERSRRMVHRERGRVDVILTGIGTVLKDDPMLTARGVRRKRIAKRVVIDAQLQIPHTCKLIQTIEHAPTIVACSEGALREQPEKTAMLRACGVQFIAVPTGDDGIMPLACVLRELVSTYEASTVLVEAGTGLLSCLFQQNLVNEAWVFIAPLLLGDDHAPSSIRGMTVAKLTDRARLQTISVRRCGVDVMARYRVQSSPNI